MDESQQAGDAPELAADSGAGEQLDNTAEAREQDDAGHTGEADAAGHDDGEDVEYEGKAYRLPKELKEALLRQADYTRKTQELADSRRTFETQREQIAQAMHLQHQVAGQVAQVIAIDRELQKYDQVNWLQLNAENPAEAQRLLFLREQLREQRGQAQQQVNIAQHQALQVQQAALAKQMEDGRQQLVKDGWTGEVARQVREYGLKTGFSENDLSELRSPLVAQTLRKAMLYDQLMNQKGKPKAEPAAPAVKPVTTIRAKDSGQNPTGYWPGMSDKQYADFRRRQIAQRR